MTREEQFYQEAARLNARMDALLNNDAGDIPLNSEYKLLKSKYRNEIKAEIADMKSVDKPIKVEIKKHDKEYQKKLDWVMDHSPIAGSTWTVPDPNAPVDPTPEP